MTGRERWISKRELGEHFDVSLRSITRINPPHIRIGGQNRYLLSEVEAWLRAGHGAENVIEFPTDEEAA